MKNLFLLGLIFFGAAVLATMLIWFSRTVPWPILPEGAAYSDLFTTQCVAGFRHYTTKETKSHEEGIMGPTYLVDKNNRLIGMGYMFNDADLTSGKVITKDGIEREFLGSPDPLLIGKQVDHIDIQKIKKGHAGFEEDHYDVHVYFISHEEERQLSDYNLSL